MIRLLDTNICIYFLNKKSEKLLEHFKQTRPSDIKLSAITVAELYYGAEKSKAKPKNLQRINRFIAPFEIIPFDEEACQTYGRIRSEVEQSGTPVGPMDLLIPSIALARGHSIVTNNTREFSRIKGLKIENWL